MNFKTRSPGAIDASNRSQGQQETHTQRTDEKTRVVEKVVVARVGLKRLLLVNARQRSMMADEASRARR